jgi:hypothetical protein
VSLDREAEKLPFGCAAKHPRDSRVQKANDRLEHPVRRVRVAAMNAENSPAETEHHRSVGVGDDPINISQPELVEPDREVIVEQE